MNNKAEFSRVSDEISNLFCQYLEVHQAAVLDAEDRTWDEVSLCYTSESADKSSWDWFEERKSLILGAHGWTVEEYETAEKAETEAWYAALERTPIDPVPPLHVIHDPEDEPED